MLSVVTLPGFMVVHSINVSSTATLCSGVIYEVCLYMYVRIYVHMYMWMYVLYVLNYIVHRIAYCLLT